MPSPVRGDVSPGVGPRKLGSASHATTRYTTPTVTSARPKAEASSGATPAVRRTLGVYRQVCGAGRTRTCDQGIMSLPAFLMAMRKIAHLRPGCDQADYSDSGGVDWSRYGPRPRAYGLSPDARAERRAGSSRSYFCFSARGAEDSRKQQRLRALLRFPDRSGAELSPRSIRRVDTSASGLLARKRRSTGHSCSDRWSSSNTGVSAALGRTLARPAKAVARRLVAHALRHGPPPRLLSVYRSSSGTAPATYDRRCRSP